MYDYHVVLDLEMNPVSKENKEVFRQLHKETIEIGAVKLDKFFNVTDEFNVFVKPQFNHQVAPYITKLTGIVSTLTMKAPFFEQALKEFSDWIGDEGLVRIYSWSDSDLTQLKNECSYKQVEFPKNMKRWLDIQKVFPKMMELKNERRQISLREAAQYFDIKVDTKKVHNALYDSQITAQLLTYFLNGEYKKQVKCMQSMKKRESGMGTLGDIFGEQFRELLENKDEK